MLLHFDTTLFSSTSGFFFLISLYINVPIEPFYNQSSFICKYLYLRWLKFVGVFLRFYNVALTLLKLSHLPIHMKKKCQNLCLFFFCVVGIFQTNFAARNRHRHFRIIKHAWYILYRTTSDHKNTHSHQYTEWFTNM